MRKKIVAGNWKMNNDLSQTQTLLNDLKKQVLPENVAIIVAPSFTNLYAAFESLRDHKIEVAAQNMHQSDAGAFTGEVSAAMLKSVGVKTVIVGHSERRSYYNEDNSVLSEKVNTALDNGMHIIFCFGEELDQRKAGNHYEVVKEQLEEGLFHISEENFKNIVLAYEPVWAIGTGETATPDQAQQMHHFIRETVAENYSEAIANQVSIVYGGSVKPNNVTEIFSQPDVDGGLIGGASLSAESFMAIVNAFQNK
ncbi:triose-phosphate isomerase [Jejudonia soesokkakensis]|uniref:Triosephosphate isomerase n=1 Tax=Jejudonia soesokkakensis TaxID=1323432 RepID=A0ABW2MTT1_9FLAO